LLTPLVSNVGPANEKINCIDEFRRAREDLEPGFYNSLTYFELWTQGFINLMEEKGVLTRAEVETRAPRDPQGRPIDPNTKQPIQGKPDLGHKTGNEFWREKARAEAEGLTQKQFNDRMNNPDLYQLEDPASNQSHAHEQKR